MVTFVFGVIISFICPFLFRIQNLLLGLCVGNRSISISNIREIFLTTKIQLVLIYDTSIFYKNKYSNKLFGALRLAVGYFLYILPAMLIGILLLVCSSTSFICQEMEAPFLLNNKINSKENMTHLYEKRRENCDEWGYCDDGRTEYNYYLNYVFHFSRIHHTNFRNNYILVQ